MITQIFEYMGHNQKASSVDHIKLYVCQEVYQFQRYWLEVFEKINGCECFLKIR